MRVKDILKSKRRADEIIAVGPGATVAEAIKTMVDCDTGSVVVQDGTRDLLGLLTFREVLKCVHENRESCLAIRVSELMDPDPGVATPTDTVDQIRNLMTTRHLRYLPVMQEGKLQAVISFYDVARAAAKSADFENRMLRQYISDWPAEE